MAYYVMFKPGHEGLLLKRIVNRVQQEIIKMKVPLEVAIYPVGLDDAVKEFEDVVGHESVQIVGIAGIMSCCGKTTLAKKLFNRKSKDFKNRSFLFDVREGALPDLQTKLLRDLIHFTHIPPFTGASEIKPILAGHFESVSPRVLIILDHVDDVNQLDALLPAKGSTLGSGSLIIVTTRNLAVLELWGINSLYNMQNLNLHHAKRLFCYHSFLQRSPVDGFEDLVQGFVSACDGLPLSLNVFGEILYKQPRERWEYNLERSPDCPRA